MKRKNFAKISHTPKHLPKLIPLLVPLSEGPYLPQLNYKDSENIWGCVELARTWGEDDVVWKRRLVLRWTKGVSGRTDDGAESYS
jgi:hypothetical protein